MFDHVDGYISCYECLFDGPACEIQGTGIERKFKTYSEARVHAKAHRDAGHTPCPSDDYFRIAIEDEGDDVKAYMEQPHESL